MVKTTLHATAIAINGNGVIILGPSSAGKSDLALRLIDRGAILISDDQILIDGDKHNPILSQGPHHMDAIEVRGVGIIPMPCVTNIPLKLAVELSTQYERSPSPLPIKNITAYSVPFLRVSPQEATASIKIELALKNLIFLTNIHTYKK